MEGGEKAFNEKIADIEIGLDPIFGKGEERNLATTYCITRDDAEKAFGPNTGKPNGGEFSYYAHKFDYASKGYDIYVKLVFGGGLAGVGVVEFKCARTLSIMQYRIHKVPEN